MKQILISSFLLLSGTASASLLPMQSDYYYKLGGDSDVYIPPVNRDQVIVIGGNINTGTGLNCNLFNPVVSITNTFQDLKNSATGIPASVIDNLKGPVAGYNLLLTPSRALDNLSPPNSKTNHFISYWPAPPDAAQWAVLVLGDIQISHQAASRDVKAGVGLSTLLQSCPKVASSKTCVTNVSSYLWQLVDKKIPSTEVNLRKLAASNILITDDIILSIQRMPREQQVLTVAKLSEEIAIQNLLDEAMMLRRLLQAGFQIQEVQNLKPAQTMVNSALKKLNSEIQTLAFENDVRKKMMGQTLNLIMELRAHDMAASIPGDDHEQAVVKNGAVYPNQ